ncbi:hypothetical protein L2E82_02942 [Cichorium intybus]|uniref:Uncharacterized protein n=1 Tax=Cichorium intybus TaxID=13427 RepID=A0ACB9H483_CICIN|nr:hypothetical protein L2E82_02942 [Cichorium intybus]
MVIAGSGFTISSTFTNFSGFTISSTFTDFSRFSDFSAATMFFDSDKVSFGSDLGRAEKALVIQLARLTRWKMVPRLTSVVTAAVVVAQFGDVDEGSSGMAFKSETLP